MENACVHIYMGDGKGKTSAAVGLCHRCAGRGFKVGITSFLKDFDSGEYLGNPPFHIFSGVQVEGFWFNKSEEEKDVIRAKSKKHLHHIFECAVNENYDLLVLDEVVGAIEVGCIDEADVIRLMKEKPKGLELVLTGRNPSKALCDMADYISEIKAIRHPYEKGVKPRLGIEK